MDSNSGKVIDCRAHDEIRNQMAHGAPVRPLREATEELMLMTAVEETDLRWLWPGRLPLGKMIVLDGDPGLGKSVLTLDLAARVSRGGSMPDGSRGDVDGPAGVVLLSVEDDPKDTIKPRLRVADADMSRVALMHAVREPPVRNEDPLGRLRQPSLRDVGALRGAIGRLQAKLVIIDPLMAFLTGDSHRDQDVRQALSPLAALAEETGVTVLVVRHLNKSGGDNALYRGGGSIGIIGAARGGLIVAKDPDDPTDKRRVLAVTKCNLSPDAAPALAYHLESCGKAPRVVWEGDSEHTQKTLLASDGHDGGKHRPVDEAMAFLRGILADGPMPCNQVQERATEQGISQRTLDRARRKLGVRSTPTGFGGPWRWTLPSARNRTPAPHPKEVVESGDTEQKVADCAEFEDSPPTRSGRFLGKVVDSGVAGVAQANGATSPAATPIPDPLPPQVQLALDVLGGTVTKFRYPGADDE